MHLVHYIRLVHPLLPTQSVHHLVQMVGLAVFDFLAFVERELVGFAVAAVLALWMLH